MHAYYKIEIKFQCALHFNEHLLNNNVIYVWVCVCIFFFSSRLISFKIINDGYETKTNKEMDFIFDEKSNFVM